MISLAVLEDLSTTCYTPDVEGKSMFARSIYSPTQIFAQSPSSRGREAEEHKSKAYVGPGYASNTAVPGTVSAME